MGYSSSQRQRGGFAKSAKRAEPEWPMAGDGQPMWTVLEQIPLQTSSNSDRHCGPRMGGGSRKVERGVCDHCYIRGAFKGKIEACLSGGQRSAPYCSGHGENATQINPFIIPSESNALRDLLCIRRERGAKKRRHPLARGREFSGGRWSMQRARTVERSSSSLGHKSFGLGGGRSNK